MKNRIFAMFAVLLLLFMTACGQSGTGESTLSSKPEPTVSATTTCPTLETTVPETTLPPATETVETEPMHSAYYIPGVETEDVITYFCEVCLDGEYVNAGDPSVVQKWTAPVYYTVEGDYTDVDLVVLDTIARWLNNLEGFPGFFRTEDPANRNMRICFGTQQEMIDLMGDFTNGLDGAVTFWYDTDVIYDAIICCRADLDQELRNSVILEEVYNGLGPAQDTVLRPDSIIYQEFSQPQWLSPEDELLLQLLYHPEIQPGMNAAECAEIIRSLYY